jgi:hypothetical protein
MGFRPPAILMREIGIHVIWTIFAFWVICSAVVEYGWLPDMGNNLNVFRSISHACGSVSIVYLCFQLGLRRLAGTDKFFLFSGLIIGLAMDLAGGFLVTSAGIIAAALFAFTLGRRRVPVFMTLFCAALLGVLQLGKDEYRNAYWNEGQNYSTDYDVDLITRYETWFQASWKRMTTDHDSNEGQADLFRRADLLQVLAVVIDATPNRLPYLNGLTYQILPYMIMPRQFWGDKPRGSLPTEFLAVTYGLQSAGSVEYTSVTVGPIAEGWANFGWLGLVFAGAVFGALFGIPARISISLVPRQVGWLMASIFLVYSVDTGHAIVEVCCSLLTGLLMGLMILVFVSRSCIALRMARLVPGLSHKKPEPALK